MLNISAALKAEITDGKVARFAKVTLSDATVIALTSYHLPLTADGDTYQPIPDLAPSSMLQTSDGLVDNQKVFVNWFGNHFNINDLFAGKYDDAELEIGWIGWDMVTPERVILFSGTFGEITWDDTGLTAEGLSDIKALDNKIGRTYTAADPFSFGDAHWGLAAGPYTFTGSVDYILSQRYKFKIAGDAATQADKYFTYGQLTWTSGNNSGLKSEVKIHEVNANPNIGKSIELYVPTPYGITVGDTFSVVAGYDGSFEQAKTKFNNGVNFGGFPHIKVISSE